MSHNNLQPWLRRMIRPSVKFIKILYISCCYINHAYLRSDSNITEQGLRATCQLALTRRSSLLRVGIW